MLILFLLLLECSVKLFSCEDSYVCRQCGNIVLTIPSIFNKPSIIAKEILNEKVLGPNQTTKNILVQKFINPENIPLYLISTKTANVFEFGKKIVKDSFYKDFTHVPVFCKKCRKHLGWLYEPRQSACLKSDPEEMCHELYDKNAFYGILRSEICSRNYADSLIIYRQHL
ncbi:unnamed protein product [Gordionus sp. m RMFG-2023]|uniref:uncharacterized protein LOC135930470 n=1 Tax=Gordionus sp. m RMFG-2023 TaxID=3053472 RepID=UPI0030E3E889